MIMLSILAAMGESGILVFFLGLILWIIVSVAVAFFLSFWFGGMVLDDLGVWAALKKSFSIAKRCFWTLLGIALLIAVVEGILGGVVGFFTFIPLLPTILNSAVTAVASVVHMAFLFMLYRSFQPSDKVEMDDVNVIY
jgi:hypothetical protein